MLTQNQLNDQFQQAFKRNASPDEYNKYAGASLDQLSSGALQKAYDLSGSYAKDPNSPTVQRLSDRKVYSNSQDFFNDSGLVSFDNVKFSNDFQAPNNQQPAQADPNAAPQPLDYQKVYNDALDKYGANNAKSNIDAINSRLSQIDQSIQSMKQSKLAQASASGGVVDEAQLEAEVAAANQPLLIERDALAKQLTYSQQAYNNAARQAQAEADFAQKTNAQQIAAYNATQKSQYQNASLAQKGYFSNATDAIKALTQYASQIRAGTLDPASIDPSLLNSIDQAAGFADGTAASILGSGNGSFVGSLGGGFPTGAQNNPNSAAAVNNVAGMKQNGKYISYDNPQDSFNAVVADITAKQQGKTSTGLNGNSTLEQFVNTWINGPGKGRQPGQGYTADDVAKFLGISTTTKFGKIDATQLAGAIAHFETGYSPANKENFSQFYTSADAPDPSIANVVDPKTGITPNSVYQNAIQYALDGKTPSLGLGSSAQVKAQRAAIQNKAGAMVAAAGTTYPALQAAYKANSQALSKILPTFNQLVVNEQNAKKNFGVLISLAQNMDDNTFQTSIPMLNKWIRTGQVELSGDPNVNNFQSQLILTMTEYAKVVTGQTSGAGVTDSARSEMQALLNSGLDADAIQSYFTNVATPDMENRSGSYLDQINGINSTIGSFLGVASGAQANGGSQPTGSADDSQSLRSKYNY